MKREDKQTMPVVTAEDNDLSPKPSGHIVITPFINFRKSFKRFKQKKRPLQEECVNKIDNNANKIKSPERDLENTMNILKRLSAYRASKKKKKKTSINSSLNIVRWSSCESISDGKILKHNSLRRSRASLLVPITPNDCCHVRNGSARKIPQYKSMNYINNRTKTLSSEELPLNMSTTTENFNDEISQELSQFFNNTSSLTSITNNTLNGTPNVNKRSKIKTSKSHSLSLPNINEHKLEETSICFDIDNVDVIVEEDIIGGTSTSCQQTNLIQGREERYKRYSTSHSTDKLLLKPTSISDMFSMYLSNDSIFSASSVSINRPPVPCCPKPIDRRNLILKSASTEALSARKYLRSDENLSNEHLLARKRTNSSPDCTAQKKKEIRKSADFALSVNNEESRLESMNSRLPKTNLRGYTSTTDLPTLFFNERLWKKALSCQVRFTCYFLILPFTVRSYHLLFYLFTCCMHFFIRIIWGSAIFTFMGRFIQKLWLGKKTK